MNENKDATENLGGTHCYADIECFVDREIEAMSESGQWSFHAVDALLGLQARIDEKLISMSAACQHEPTCTGWWWLLWPKDAEWKCVFVDDDDSGLWVRGMGQRSVRECSNEGGKWRGPIRVPSA